ncbi:hypothetical protein AB0J35_57700 [Nonomuraea angiospora]|uniref:hypothetical protein n=1 Tax=Nonomuraea angiospora TaxID=46172 RepID=UPI003442C098
MHDPTAAAATAPTHRAQQADPIERGGLAVVIAAAVVLSFSALQGLGRYAGFGDWQLPLIDWGFPLSLLLPLCIDAYGAVAARIATNRAYSDETRQHAMIHSGIAIAVGVIGNAAYHLIESHVIKLDGSVLVTLVIVVSIVPPVALGALVHLISECGRDRQESEQVHSPAAVPAPAPDRVRELGDVPDQAHGQIHVPAAPPAAAAPAAPQPRSAEQQLLYELDLPLDQAGPYPARHAQTPPAPAPGPAPETDQVRLPEPPPELRPLALKAVETFAPDGRLETVPPLRVIKSTLKVGQPKAERVQEYLAEVAAG